VRHRLAAPHAHRQRDPDVGEGRARRPEQRHPGCARRARTACSSPPPADRCTTTPSGASSSENGVRTSRHGAPTVWAARQSGRVRLRMRAPWRAWPGVGSRRDSASSRSGPIGGTTPRRWRLRSAIADWTSSRRPMAVRSDAPQITEPPTSTPAAAAATRRPLRSPRQGVHRELADRPEWVGAETALRLRSASGGHEASRRHQELER
jgi:hypothetical protein